MEERAAPCRDGQRVLGALITVWTRRCVRALYILPGSHIHTCTLSKTQKLELKPLHVENTRIHFSSSIHQSLYLSNAARPCQEQEDGKCWSELGEESRLCTWACEKPPAVSSASTVLAALARSGALMCIFPWPWRVCSMAMAGLLGEGSACPQEPVVVAAQLTAEHMHSLTRLVQPGL